MLELNELLKSARICVVAKDLHHKFLNCSEGFLEYFGFDSSNQILGKNDFDLFPYDFAKLYQAGDSKALRGESYINVLEVFSTPKQSFSMLVNKAPLKNRNDETIGVVISLFDVTRNVGKFSGFQFDPKRKRYSFTVGSSSEYLTLQEYAAFAYLVKGFTGVQIAEKLNLSVRTVEKYIEIIKLKLQCRSKFQIAQTAIEMGLIPNLS